MCYNVHNSKEYRSCVLREGDGGSESTIYYSGMYKHNLHKCISLHDNIAIERK